MGSAIKGESKMAVLRTVLTVVFIIICIVISAIVLLQEGKSAGLGAISGAAESYWGKNKGRSMEGALVKITRWLTVAFLLIAIVLNISKFG
jgi:preprotein translocase subunit SecG